MSQYNPFAVPANPHIKVTDSQLKRLMFASIAKSKKSVVRKNGKLIMPPTVASSIASHTQCVGDIQINRLFRQRIVPTSRSVSQKVESSKAAIGQHHLSVDAQVSSVDIPVNALKSDPKPRAACEAVAPELPKHSLVFVRWIGQAISLDNQLFRAMAAALAQFRVVWSE